MSRALDFSSWPLNQVVVGSEVTFQFWFLDGGHGFYPFNMSDGLAVTVCP